MIEVCTLSNEEHTVTRGRSVGQTTTRTIALAVDKFNILIAERTGDGQLVGKKFSHSLAHFVNYVADNNLSDIHVPFGQGLSQLLNIPCSPTASLQEIERLFDVNKRADDASGELLLYRRLKEVCGDADSDDE